MGASASLDSASDSFGMIERGRGLLVLSKKVPYGTQWGISVDRNLLRRARWKALFN